MSLLRLIAVSALCVSPFMVSAQEVIDTSSKAANPFKDVSSPAANAKKGVTVLQGLNKITARTQEIRIQTGSHAQFGDLWIRSVTCWSAPADQRPEHAALLDIMERTPNKGDVRRFSGWMFASSPAISALEHPVYDVRVIECDS